MAADRRRRWLVVAAVLAPLVVVALTAPFALQQAGPPQDEGALLVYADRVLHGAVAHRDFQTFYGPAMPWVLAGLSFGRGPGLWLERAIGLLDVLLVVALVAALAINWGRLQAVTSAVVAAAILAQLDVPAIPWVAGVAFALASLVIWKAGATRSGRSGPILLASAGACASLAVAFRIDLAPVVALLLILFVAGRDRKGLWFAAGVVVGALPLVAHIVVASPGAVWQTIAVDGLRASSARRLPIPPTSLTARAGLFLTLAATALIVAAAAISLYRDRGATRTRLLTGVAALCVGVLPEMLQRADLVPHILGAACVSVAFVPVSMTVVAEGFRVLHRSSVVVGSAIVCLLAGGLWAVESVGALHAIAGTQVSDHGRNFVLTNAEAADARQALSYVDELTRPGQRLFIGPMDMRRTNYTATYLYYLLPQLMPATYYLEMEPLTANRPGSRLASDVASADVLVLTTEWDNWNEPNTSMQYGSDRPNQVVADLFCLRAHAGVFRVFTKCH